MTAASDRLIWAADCAEWAGIQARRRRGWLTTWSAQRRMELLGFTSASVAIKVADLLKNEGNLLASVAETPWLHSAPNETRTELLLAVADAILAGVEA